MNIITRSTFLHLRFAFSLLLLPVYIFAISEARVVNPLDAVLVFIAWHFFAYPASNGYNSYFDKDKESIALLKNPPAVDRTLYYTSLAFELMGILIALLVNLEFCFSVLIYGLLSKMYSHPKVRLKKSPVISFLVVFFFQGAFVFWTSYAAVSGLSFYAHWNLDPHFRIAGWICSFLIGASYPLTQVYQHKEDGDRGDNTLSRSLGIVGSFCFSGALFILATLLIQVYWDRLEAPENFYLFLGCSMPVAVVFTRWFYRVLRDRSEANFQNMTRMTFTSAGMMTLYFTILLVKG